MYLPHLLLGISSGSLIGSRKRPPQQYLYPPRLQYIAPSLIFKRHIILFEIIEDIECTFLTGAISPDRMNTSS